MFNPLTGFLDAIGHGADSPLPMREALIEAYAKYQRLSVRAAGTVFTKLDP